VMDSSSGKDGKKKCLSSWELNPGLLRLLE
jgi:hypothetical protein